MSESFSTELARADRLLAEVPLPAETDRRLQRRLGAAIGRRSLLVPLAGLALAGALVAGVIILVAVSSRPPSPRWSGLRLAQSSNDLVSSSDGEELEVRSGAATLFDEASGVELRIGRPVTLRREARGTRVVRGEVELQVARRDASTPTRVLVSHGEIEVHGTRFVVKQGPDGGEVILYEGSIVFRCADGRELEVSPGQTLHWPVPPPAPAAAPAPVIVPEDEPPAALSPAPPDADWRLHDRLRRAHLLLERIPRLRDEGRDEQAVRELSAAMSQDLPAVAREQLSWMLAELLIDRGQSDRACRHLRDHAWRYPAGRYEEQVNTALVGCR